MIITFLLGINDEIEMDFEPYTSEFEESEFFDPLNIDFNGAITEMVKRHPEIQEYIDISYEEIIKELGSVRELTQETLRVKLLNSIYGSFEAGETFEEWKEIIFSTGKFKQDDAYFHTIYRMNIFNSYNAGLYKQQERNISFKPYGLFDAVGDERTTEVCNQNNGLIFPINDPFWDTNYPPLHFNCFDKETEVLTDKGFKLFKDLDKTEKFYSINPETHEVDLIKAKDYIKYFRKDKMIHFKNDNFDLLVTPDHQMCYFDKWHVEKNNDTKLRFRNADTMAVSNTIPRTFLKWNGILKENINIGNEKYDTKLFCEFLGIYLGYGSITMKHEPTNYFQLKISQEKEQEKIDYIYNLMCKLFYNVKLWQGGIFVSSNDIELFNFFKKLGYSYEKYIPNEFKELDKEYLKLILKGLEITDCYKTKEKEFKGYISNSIRCFFTSSKKLAEDIGELILKIGKRPSYDFSLRIQGKKQEFKNGTYTIKHDCYRIFELSSLNYSHKKKFIKEIDYEDFVYCVELEKYHTLLVRRNGKVTWSGNCRSERIALSIEDLQDEGIDLSTIGQYKLGGIIEPQEGFGGYPLNPDELEKQIKIKKDEAYNMFQRLEEFYRS